LIKRNAIWKNRNSPGKGKSINGGGRKSIEKETKLAEKGVTDSKETLERVEERGNLTQRRKTKKGKTL